MNRLNAEDVGRQLADFLTKHRHSLSLRQFAGYIEEYTGESISPARLSQIKNLKAGKVYDSVLERIIRSMEMYENKICEPVSTQNMQKIIVACRASMGDQTMIVFTGESGYGKTVAARQYASLNPEVVHITAFASFTKRALLGALSDAAGVNYTIRRSPHLVLMDLIIARPKQIVVDEADKLTADSFECLRFLRDEADTSIILIGLPCLITKLRTSSSKVGNLSQLYSRIGAHHELDAPSDPEIKKIIRNMGITNEALINAIYKYAVDKFTHKKNMHRIEEVVKELKKTAATNKKQLNACPPEWVDLIAEDMI